MYLSYDQEKRGRRNAYLNVNVNLNTDPSPHTEHDLEATLAQS